MYVRFRWILAIISRSMSLNDIFEDAAGHVLGLHAGLRH